MVTHALIIVAELTGPIVMGRGVGGRKERSHNRDDKKVDIGRPRL